MDENPYRSPRDVFGPSVRSLRDRPNPGLAISCVLIAVLFLFLLNVAVQRATWSLGSIVGIGWAGSTSAAFFTISWGTFTGRRTPVIAGACGALIALATMFTLVIGFC
ncbi:MAG TPA: hypothetical protein VND64_35270 [Pirellulales bacterium]|nr:hypothetical protein [Pirellulales bacterium]